MHVVSIYRYPVKGLSPEPLPSAPLATGETIPLDRAYAIENGRGGFDPDAPRHLPKIHFLMLMRDERLATLQTHLDPESHVLTVQRAGRQVARGDLKTAIGRSLIEQFLAAYMKGSLRGAPRIVASPGHSFSDVAAKCLHIVNLASVRELERTVGRPVDPLRFRANLYIDGAEPWSELEWVGRHIAIGEGRLVVVKRTTRCAATDVDPATGVRNLSIPAALQRARGHGDFGVYAAVETPTTITVDDAISVQ